MQRAVAEEINLPSVPLDQTAGSYCLRLSQPCQSTDQSVDFGRGLSWYLLSVLVIPAWLSWEAVAIWAVFGICRPNIIRMFSFNLLRVCVSKKYTKYKFWLKDHFLVFLLNTRTKQDLALSCNSQYRPCLSAWAVGVPAAMTLKEDLLSYMFSKMKHIYAWVRGYESIFFKHFGVLTFAYWSPLDIFCFLGLHMW